MKDRWRREESGKGAGVDVKCEVLPSAISEHVSELGAAPRFLDCTEQWSRSGRLTLELGINSGSVASVDFHRNFSCLIGL